MASYRIFCFGDSITFGASDSEGGWADRLKRNLFEREDNAPDADRYQVYNLGINGNTSKDLARRLASETEARMSPNWQNVFIIAIGINDSRFNKTLNKVEVDLESFRHNILQIVTAAQKYSDKICIIGLTPVAKPQIDFKALVYKNEDIQKYDDVLHEISQELQVPKLSIFAEAQNDETFMQSLFPDMLHPNSNGHQWLHERIEPFILSSVLSEEL